MTVVKNDSHYDDYGLEVTECAFGDLCKREVRIEYNTMDGLITLYGDKEISLLIEFWAEKEKKLELIGALKEELKVNVGVTVRTVVY